MASYFLDTSAIVKRYFPEQGRSYLPRLLARPDVLLASHIGAHGCWDAHAAIGLLVNFEQGQQDAWRGQGGVIERVDEF